MTISKWNCWAVVGCVCAHPCCVCQVASVVSTWEAQLFMWSESEVAQSCPALCGLMDCSPPGSSVHGIVQARVLEWVAISFSRASSQPRDQAQVSCVVGRRFPIWATREVCWYTCTQFWGGHDREFTTLPAPIYASAVEEKASLVVQQ